MSELIREQASKIAELEEYITQVEKQRDDLLADIATAEQDSRQKQARIDRLEAENDDLNKLCACNESTMQDLIVQRDGLLAEQKSLGAAIERQHSAAEQLAGRVMQLEQQCDDLLAALDAMVTAFSYADGSELFRAAALLKANDAIAAVRGAAQQFMPTIY